VKPLIYLWPCVTLIFDLLNPKVDGSTPLLRRSSRCQFASKSVHSFSKYHVHKFGNHCCVRYGQKDGREYNTSARRSHWPGEGITTVTVQKSTELKTSRNEVLVWTSTPSHTATSRCCL